MARKKSATSPRKTVASSEDGQVDQDVNVESAEQSVTAAREQLQAAETLLEQVREKATEQVAKLRDKSAGELIDGTLEFVRKHPGLGVLTAASVGFFFARMFRR